MRGVSNFNPCLLYFITLIFYCFADALKGVHLNNSKYFLIFGDILILFVSLSVAFNKSNSISFDKNLSLIKKVPSPLIWFFIFYVFYILIRTLFPSYSEPVLAIGGVRTHLLGFFLVPFGVYLSRDEKGELFYKITIFLLGVILLIFVGQLIQVLSIGKDIPVISDLLYRIVAKHSFHYNGDHFPVLLKNSFFNSNKRLGHIIIFSYLFLLYSNSVGARKNYLRTPIYLVATAICILSIFFSGSREAMVVLLFVFFFYFIFFRQMIVSTLLMSITLFSLIAILFFIFVDTSNFGSLIFDLKHRISFLVSEPEDYLDKFRWMVLSPFNSASKILGGESLFFGRGLGAFGQEVMLDSFYRDLSQNHIFNLSTIRGDSGAMKLIVEVGFFGTFLFFLLYLYVIFRYSVLPLMVVTLDSSDKNLLSLYMIPIVWMVFFLKAFPVHSDMLNAMFMFPVIGFLIGKRPEVN